MESSDHDRWWLMVFTGTVSSRSSRSSTGGAPGEREILELNPEREARICSQTHWPRLEPGSLNLEVQPQVVQALKEYLPLIHERADHVRYPDRWEHIPKLRRGYSYYEALARAGGREEPVLVRRAVNPVPSRVELFAPVRLRDALSVSDGDMMEVEVTASQL